MLTVNKQETDRGIFIALVGTIEETVNFEQLIGPFHGLLTVNCRGITRINSVGVKTWMRYFQSLKMRGFHFKFIECAPPIVHQLNMITNFACGGEIESILLPYTCTTCKKELASMVLTKDLIAAGLKVPEVKCATPQCEVYFDDDADDYLYFLSEE